MEKLKIQQDKRGQSLEGLYGGILVIASIGILLALMLYIFSSMGQSFQVPNTAVTVANESGFANITGYTVNGASQDAFANPVLTLLVNRTSGATIGLGNASITSAGVVKNASSVQWSTLNISYTYTYDADTTSSNATTSLITMFVDFLPWLGIILLVLAAGVVLFFVIRSFAGGNRGV